MKKKLIIGIISVLLILTGVGYGVGSFFVHYALSPVSDSAKRNINEEDKIDTAKGTEKVILQNQKKEQKKATEFKKTTSNANITNNDNGVTQNITFNNLVKTPSEVARQIRKVGRELAFG